MKALASALGVALLAVGATACTGEEPPKTAPKSTPPSFTEVQAPTQPAQVAQIAERAMQAAQSVQVRVSSTSQAGNPDESTARIRFSGGSPMAHVTLVEGSGTSQGILLNGTMYLRSGDEPVVPGKPWLKLTRQDLANPKLGPFGRLFKLVFDEMEAAVKDATGDTGLAVVGAGTLDRPPVTENLGGVPVTRYDGKTDTEKLRAVDREFASLADQGVKSVPWRMWIDQYGLPRRFVIDLETPAAKVSSSAVYSEWGKDQSITPPPGGQVATINDIGS
ncbi:MAG: hypothetical protein GEV11_06330 [Streptosporangiales bacterium]|nr:hypothetical protein [Streptosporangiales bacterium]